MKSRLTNRFLIVTISLLILTSSQIIYAQNYDANANPREQRMKWWDQARFGMFIHWGLYSIPAGTWKGEDIEELGEWIMAYADIPADDYKKLALQFNPEQFNAREWVQIAKDAGMKYIIITTRHHDGFCLFDTKHTDWDVMDATPFKRDIIKELSDECKNAGIRFCAYYSILEWHHPAMELNSDFDDLEPFSDQAHDGGPFTHIDSTWRKYGNVRVAEGKKSEFIDYMKAQLKELVDNYNPGIIWFDGGWVDWWTPEDGKELLQYLWSLNPELIVNNRAAEDFDTDVWYGDYGTPEQSIPLEGLNYRWESCMTMNSTWGYKTYDQNWKPPQLLIAQLVDIISKGGNFLLNVGPTPEGRQDLVEELYDTPEVASVHLPFTARDIRFTRKGNHVYATLLGWPEENAIIKSLGKGKSQGFKIIDVSMLGSEEEINWEQIRRGLRVSVPARKPCKYAYVYKISIEEVNQQHTKFSQLP